MNLKVKERASKKALRLQSSFLIRTKKTRHSPQMKRFFPLLISLFGIHFPGGSKGKESACDAKDQGWIPGWGRSPGEGNGNPLQNSYLENSMDRGAWCATIHGITKSRAQLCNWTTAVSQNNTLEEESISGIPKLVNLLVALDMTITKFYWEKFTRKYVWYGVTQIESQVVIKLDCHYLCIKLLFTASLVAQRIRNMPAMQETWVQSLGQKDSLEKGMSIHSSILACINPWTEEPGGPWGHKELDTTEWLTLFICKHMVCKIIIGVTA